MAADSNEKDELFQADRRKLPREGETDRRDFLRPTNYLRILGFAGAILVALAICAAIYFRNS